MGTELLCTCDCIIEETMGKHECECECPLCRDKLSDEERQMIEDAKKELEEMLADRNCHSCDHSFFMTSLVGAGLCRKSPPVNHVMPKPSEQTALSRPVAAPPSMEVVLHSAFPKIYRNFRCGEWVPGEKYSGPEVKSCASCKCNEG